MRKFLITAAAAATTLALAAPAAAQWGPQPGYGYGYNNNYGQVRSLQARVDNLQREIYRLDRRNVLSNREARRLQNEAQSIEYRLRRAGYNGLNYNEQRDIAYRLARLEQNIRYQANDGNRRVGYGYGNGYPDRDRDGRDDRREDDRGWDHD
jgi:hypothetical protein